MKNSIFLTVIALVSFINVSTASTNVSTLKFDDEVTPLCVAIYKGDLETVKKFVEYGTDVNQKSNGLTPLMIAARSNKVEIVKYLVENCHVKVTDRDSNNFTALKYAELSNATETVQYLKNIK